MFSIINHIKMYKILKRQSCACRRHFEIILLICLTIFASILLVYHVRKSIGELRVDYGRYEQNLPNERELRNVQLKSMLRCYDQSLQLERLQHGGFWLLKNLIRGRLSINMGCAESITYTTNGDYTFMESLGTVVTRWLGPISFALFAPGYDFNATMDAIQYARNCLPESQLIRDYVTFHLYFPNDHMPDQRVPVTEEEALEWPFDCQLLEAPYENVDRDKMYKTMKNLTYPINVGRNIARKSANTHFIFACDIELFPSTRFIEQFLQMAFNNPDSVLRGDNPPRVFPLAVFELQSNATPPETKDQLMVMLKSHAAIPFHSYVCKNCHLVPGQDKWVEANVTDELEVFTVGKRTGEFKYWEPFYVSDNTEPEFDERVTWEGQSNKRIQNYAMCLLNYDYYILHPAFLVHSPGIKKYNPKSERLRYVEPTNKLIVKKIVPEYAVLYGENKQCTV